MVCYGGACEKTCPMYNIHNPRIVECRECGKSLLSWYAQDGVCPECAERLCAEVPEENVKD